MREGENWVALTIQLGLVHARQAKRGVMRRRRCATLMVLCGGVSLALGCPVSSPEQVDTSATGIASTMASADDCGGGSSSDDGPATTTSAGTSSTTTAADETTTGDTAPPPVKLDVGAIPDAPGEGNTCGAPSPVTCDGDDDDPFHAIGLNCPGGPQVEGAITGEAQAFLVYQGNLGASNPPAYPPREGEKFLIMATGVAQQLDDPGMFTSTDLPANDPLNALPAPLVMTAVSQTETCADNPGLIGMGECSNTLEGQWSQGQGAHDYAEVRIDVEVPAGTFGFSYDFAFFSEEYPVWYQTQYNDMYCAWLESEQWTGNISFDEMGNPISLNAGFLDNLPGSPDLVGTSMDQNAGTKWLTTTAGVSPLEQIQVVFAVWDLSDGIWDTYIILDNWLWDCEGGPPITIPG
jgi:hypothetical protein